MCWMASYLPIAKAAGSLHLDDLFSSVNAHLERYVLVLLVKVQVRRTDRTKNREAKIGPISLD